MSKRSYSAADLGAGYGSPYQREKRRKAAMARQKRPAPRYQTVARTRGVYGQGEMKYFDSELDALAIPSSITWAACVADPILTPVVNMNTLFAPTQGAGINQRIGKACKLHKIRIRGRIEVPSQSPAGGAMLASAFRILLVQDMQTNAAQADPSVLMTPAVASLDVALCATQNTNAFGRFRVLKDKVITIQNPGSAALANAVNEQVRFFKFSIRFKTPIEVRFNSTSGGTIADIVDNSFHLYINHNWADTSNISYTCRCCYKD